MKLLSERLNKSIGNWQRETGRNFSNTEFAKICGVSKLTVGDWRKGRTLKMSSETLLNAAKFLNVNPRWLWRWQRRLTNTGTQK